MAANWRIRYAAWMNSMTGETYLWPIATNANVRELIREFGITPDHLIAHLSEFDSSEAADNFITEIRKD